MKVWKTDGAIVSVHYFIVFEGQRRQYTVQKRKVEKKSQKTKTPPGKKHNTPDHQAHFRHDNATIHSELRESPQCNTLRGLCVL